MNNNKEKFNNDSYIKYRKDTNNVLNNFRKQINKFISQKLEYIDSVDENSLREHLLKNKLNTKIVLWLEEFIIPDVNSDNNNLKSLIQYLKNEEIECSGDEVIKQSDLKKKQLINLIEDTFGIVFITYNSSKNSSYYHTLISNILSDDMRNMIMKNLSLPSGKGTVGWIEVLAKESNYEEISINLDNTFLDLMGSVASEDLICGARSAYLIPVFNSNDKSEYIGNLFFFSPIEGFFTKLDEKFEELTDKQLEKDSKNVFTSFIDEQFKHYKLPLTIAYEFERYKKAYNSSSIFQFEESSSRDNPCETILRDITTLNSEVDAISLFDYAVAYDGQGKLLDISGGLDSIFLSVIEDIIIKQEYGNDSSIKSYEKVGAVFCNSRLSTYSSVHVKSIVGTKIVNLTSTSSTKISVETSVEFIFFEETTQEKIDNICQIVQNIIDKSNNIFLQLEYALALAKSTEDFREDAKLLLDAEKFLSKLVFSSLKLDNKYDSKIFLDILKYISKSEMLHLAYFEELKNDYDALLNDLKTENIIDLQQHCIDELFVANLKVKSDYSSVLVNNHSDVFQNDIELKKGLFNFCRLDKKIEGKAQFENNKIIVEGYEQYFPVINYNQEFGGKRGNKNILFRKNFEFCERPDLRCILSLVHFNSTKIVCNFVEAYNKNVTGGIYQDLINKLKENCPYRGKVLHNLGRHYRFGSNFFVNAYYIKGVEESDELRNIAKDYFESLCRSYEEEIYQDKYRRNPTNKDIAATTVEIEKLTVFSNSLRPLFIYGRPGAGKNFVARYCHNVSNFNCITPPFGNSEEHPYFHINCAEFSDIEFQDEVFGSVKGFHSRGDNHKLGLIFQLFGLSEYSMDRTPDDFYYYLEYCLLNRVKDMENHLNPPEIVLDKNEESYRLIWNDNLNSNSPIGTLYLSNIDALKIQSQGKLLNYLGTGKFRPLGWTGSSFQFNIKIISSSSVTGLNLRERDCFRRDLYHRLSVHYFIIPSVKERTRRLNQDSTSKMNVIFRTILDSSANVIQGVSLHDDAYAYIEQILLSDQNEFDESEGGIQGTEYTKKMLCPIFTKIDDISQIDNKCSSCKHLDKDCAFTKGSDNKLFDRVLFKSFLKLIEDEDLMLFQKMLFNAASIAEGVEGKVITTANINSLIKQYLEINHE